MCGPGRPKKQPQRSLSLFSLEATQESSAQLQGHHGRKLGHSNDPSNVPATCIIPLQVSRGEPLGDQGANVRPTSLCPSLK